MRNETAKKSDRVVFRLTRADRLELEAQAAREQVSVSEIIRRELFGPDEEKREDTE
jgi:hypothetical protein